MEEWKRQQPYELVYIDKISFPYTRSPNEFSRTWSSHSSHKPSPLDSSRRSSSATADTQFVHANVKERRGSQRLKSFPLESLGSDPPLTPRANYEMSRVNRLPPSVIFAEVPETPPRPRSMAPPASRNSGSGGGGGSGTGVSSGGWGDAPLARALFAYLSSGENQLSFLEGDLIALMGEWWMMASFEIIPRPRNYSFAR